MPPQSTINPVHWVRWEIKTRVLGGKILEKLAIRDEERPELYEVVVLNYKKRDKKWKMFFRNLF